MASDVRTLSHRRLWIAWGAIFVALVVYLSLTPDPLPTPTVEGFKTGHILAYFWITFWFAQIWRRPAQRVGIALAFTLMGVALEYIQLATGYRHFAYADMVDNGIGAALGFVAALTPMGRTMAMLDRQLQARSSS